LCGLATGDIARTATWDALKALCGQALGLDPELHDIDCVEVQRGQAGEAQIISDLLGECGLCSETGSAPPASATACD
jgi:hypothetical protein